MPSNATESGVPVTSFVMDMASVNALSTCNKACNELIGIVMHAAAARTEDGVVLVKHLDEDGEELTSWAVSMEDQKLTEQKAVTYAKKLQQGHAQMRVSIHIVYECQEEHADLLVAMHALACL